MKSDISSRKLPISDAQWDKVMAQVSGKKRAATVKEWAARHDAIVVAGGGYGVVRDALTQTPGSTWPAASANQDASHGAL